MNSGSLLTRRASPCRRKLREKGTSKDEIKTKIQGYPISRELKLKILDHLATA